MLKREREREREKKLCFFYIEILHKTNDHTPKVALPVKEAKKEQKEQKEKKNGAYLRRTPLVPCTCAYFVCLLLYSAQTTHLALDQVHVGKVL